MSTGDAAERGTVDRSLHDGLGTNAFLAIGAGLGAVGWFGTALIDRRPGIALDTLGMDALQAVVGLWALLTLAMVAIGLVFGSRAVRLSPPLWLWSILVGGALAIDVAAVRGAFEPETLQYVLWHPWLAVFAIGYGVTAAVASGRNRRAYALGSAVAAIAFVVALTFTARIEPYAFSLLGALHVGPLLADAYASPAITGHSGTEGIES